MAKKICHHCKRPLRVCLCKVVKPISHQIQFIFLQHPLEQSQVKGTAYLTYLCLQFAHFEVGESFETTLVDAALEKGQKVFLLYPEDSEPNYQSYSAHELSDTEDLSSITVIVLDGTWKKTKKILYLNPWLADLPRLSLIPQSVSQYTIRKQKNTQTRSTLEAVSEVLAQVEHNQVAVTKLSDLMQSLIKQQRSFQPNSGA